MVSLNNKKLCMQIVQHYHLFDMYLTAVETTPLISEKFPLISLPKDVVPFSSFRTIDSL